MFSRRNIRYHTRWVRLLCCFAVAALVANAVDFELLTRFDRLFEQFMLGGTPVGFTRIYKIGEIIIVFLMCLLPAIPRIEKPLYMVALAAVLLAAYVFVTLGAMSTRIVLLLPVASPVTGLIGSTILLQAMAAWSEERQRREELEGLETAREKFTDMLVHDMKKRMSSILMSFSVLEKKLPETGANTAETTATIRATAENMLILISNLMDIRKTEHEEMSLRPEPLGLRDLLDECLKEHRAVSDLIGVEVRLAPGGNPCVRVDRQIFPRILTNLLWNAMQHAPAQSTIEAGCGSDDGAEAWLYVFNRGQPIPRERQAGLFKAFVSGASEDLERPADSTGLGLTFCKLAVEAHGGSIAIESPCREHGDGVKVQLRLPAQGMLHERDSA